MTGATSVPAAGFRLSPLEPESPSSPTLAPSAAGRRPKSWVEAVTSQIALAPIHEDGLSTHQKTPAYLDEQEVAGPYKLAAAPDLPVMKAAGGRPAGKVTQGYRRFVYGFERLFRWINESAYLLSVPFLMCMLLGLAVHQHSLLVLGATVVVVLNLGRIVTGVANLAAIYFRESPLEGITFLIPPISFFYLARDWKRLNRPVRRVIGPLLTLVFVALAFIVEPWLRAEDRPSGSLREQATQGLRTMKSEIQGKLDSVPDLSSGGLQRLEREAGSALESIRSSEAVKSLEERVRAAGSSSKVADSPAAGSSPR